MKTLLMTVFSTRCIYNNRSASLSRRMNAAIVVSGRTSNSNKVLPAEGTGAHRVIMILKFFVILLHQFTLMYVYYGMGTDHVVL